MRMQGRAIAHSLPTLFSLSYDALPGLCAPTRELHPLHKHMGQGGGGVEGSGVRCLPVQEREMKTACKQDSMQAGQLGRLCTERNNALHSRA